MLIDASKVNDEVRQKIGQGDEPTMIPVEPGALEVLARFDATSDTGACADVKDYRYHYFFDSELEGLDFVLCMGERP